MKQHIALVVWALAPALALGAPTVEETGPVSTGLAGAVTARALGPTALAHNPAGMARAAGMALDVGGGARLTVYQAGTPPASGAAAVDGLRRDARSAVALDVPPAVFGRKFIVAHSSTWADEKIPRRVNSYSAAAAESAGGE